MFAIRSHRFRKETLDRVETAHSGPFPQPRAHQPLRMATVLGHSRSQSEAMLMVSDAPRREGGGAQRRRNFLVFCVRHDMHHKQAGEMASLFKRLYK